MLADPAAFSDYFERVYQRTFEVAQAVPLDRINWASAPGELTCGELIRHLGAAELMNVRGVATGVLRYDGHAAAPDAGHADALAYLARCHVEAQALVQAMPAERLQLNIPGMWQDVPGWRRLMGMIEHEIHHRSQLCSYLTQLGIAPPALFDIYVEDLPT